MDFNTVLTAKRREPARPRRRLRPPSPSDLLIWLICTLVGACIGGSLAWSFSLLSSLPETMRYGAYLLVYLQIFALGAREVTDAQSRTQVFVDPALMWLFVCAFAASTATWYHLTGTYRPYAILAGYTCYLSGIALRNYLARP